MKANNSKKREITKGQFIEFVAACKELQKIVDSPIYEKIDYNLTDDERAELNHYTEPDTLSKFTQVTIRKFTAAVESRSKKTKDLHTHTIKTLKLCKRLFEERAQKQSDSHSDFQSTSEKN